MLFILVALIVVPLVEIALFIVVGQGIGLWPTLGVIVATALAGAALLRHQGLQTLRSAQTTMAHGQAPVRHLAEGLLLFFAGALLLTPGFLTDAVGFALLVPPVRAFAAARLMGALARRADVRMTIDGTANSGFSAPRGSRDDGARPGADAHGRDVHDVDVADLDVHDPETGVPPLSTSRWGPQRKR